MIYIARCKTKKDMKIVEHDTIRNIIKYNKHDNKFSISEVVMSTAKLVRKFEMLL